jgi:brefeldin A-inhibited guanine nucleotide-exchange protein
MEDLQLRTMGLEGLVIILKSLMSSANLQQATNPQVVEESGKLEGFDQSRSVKEEMSNPEGPESFQSEHGGESVANVVGAFDRKQKLQEEIETGILRFSLSPMKGIKYLVAMGHLEFNPKAVAEFLHQHQDKLDKTAVGDLLGREKEYENGFCYQVLNEYVEAMDFSDLVFDKAIRYFLQGFRLPGEAQKIDRIMEKFAERYYIQHKDEFASADMAFILAFSTIMLQTNLHNPAIRDDKRMTKEQFIKQNKGISSDGELSDQLLSDIYDRISAEPISINEDKKVPKKEEPASFVVFHSVSDRKKKDAFNNERKEMVKVGEAMFRQKRKNSTFVQNRQINEEIYVRPMFEIVWPPVVGVISQLMENSEDSRVIENCLNAIHYSVVISCRLDCSTARNTFIHALCKFTALDTIREMKSKHLSCINLLLSVSLSEGEYLDENWIQVLQCISLLARLQLFANGVHTDDLFFSDNSSLASVSSDNLSRSNSRRMTRFLSERPSSSSMAHNSSLGDPLTKLFGGPSKAEVNRQMEEANADLISKFVDPVQLDRIFINSTNLSPVAVLHFVRSLCDVSILEITSGSAMNSLRGRENVFDASSPRIFSLQKLVEVADYNMNSRSRVDWANIWNLLAKQFSLVGVSENSALAMFAIDSLKQLSIKFLQKDELSNFNFQRLFLKPFETIILSAGNDDIKDLILRCLDIMIRACANNIRSGWRSIFGIFEVAAQQKNGEVSKIAFEIIERLMTNSFELLIYDFVELMNCLVVFVSCPHTPLSLKALKYLEKCAEHLAHGAVLPAANAQHAASDAIGLSWESSRASEARNQVGEDSSVFRLWWPLLLGLSTRVADYRLQVRVEALETLYRTLSQYGRIFSPQTWAVIFKGVLFPIIDSAKSDENLFIEQSNNYNKESWINSMAAAVLNIYSQLFLKYIENDSLVPILNDLLIVFGSCICQDNLTLATISVKVLKELLFSIGKKVDLTSTSSAVKLLRKNHIDIVTRMLKNHLLKTLIFDFSDLGSLVLDKRCPELVLRALKTAFPSLEMKSENDSSEIVTTAYGTGRLVKVFRSFTVYVLVLF